MGAVGCLIFSLFISFFGFHIQPISGVSQELEELPIVNTEQLHQLHQLTGSLEMVPVSSTVIPVTSLFGTSKPESLGVGVVQSYPLFRRSTYSRRSNFFDKSTKPGTPVRLITTRSHKASLLEVNDG